MRLLALQTFALTRFGWPPSACGISPGQTGSYAPEVTFFGGTDAGARSAASPRCGCEARAAVYLPSSFGSKARSRLAGRESKQDRRAGAIAVACQIENTDSTEGIGRMNLGGDVSKIRAAVTVRDCDGLGAAYGVVADER